MDLNKRKSDETLCVVQREEDEFISSVHGKEKNFLKLIENNNSAEER